ncbi:SDR family oxidoreductase [Bacillus wiedmannii]|uniref:SDR family oxidoreductase n=1 Tax=Bacillus wiedmannii TaxID=1890302 RepID=UPI000BF6259E|nr:SDR family oxidoreductase [Bacillus wiedmannii]PFZ98862.1 gluconate 5-dehydrogenase [Bacillus wiedmannii]
MNQHELFSLKGQNAIVTGGSGYLGSAISEGLAKYGANVMIVSRSKEKCMNLAEQLNQKYNVKCQGYALDVSDSNSINHTFEEIYNSDKKIDILINNAYFGAGKTIEEMTEWEWETGIDGSINNVFRVTKKALQYMLPKNKGNIINISSMYGVVSPDPSIYGDSGFNNPPNYGAGKAAIIQFTRYLACHYGLKGIRANSISPGPFPNIKVQKNKEFILNLNKKTALGRIGNPQELQGLIVFLASNASSYVTGQNICIDGGWTSW